MNALDNENEWHMNSGQDEYLNKLLCRDGLK